MPNFRLTLSYDGTDFHGWQSQPGLRTVQDTLEQAIAQLSGEHRVRVQASGRTDTGVHALGQVVNFHSKLTLPPVTLRRALNAHLPEDIVVREVVQVHDSFDANRDARRKCYRYVLHDGDVPDLFQRRYCYHTRFKLDISSMARAGALLKGTHDFRCFETEWPNRASSVRTITHFSINRFGDWIWLDVEADGFLYNMVRAITGTLIDVGRGYRSEDQISAILTSGDRAQAGPTAPARGLFLLRVVYE